MRPLTRIAWVGGGYLAAVLLASVAVNVRIAHTSDPAAVASSGMYAFGDTILFAGIFTLCALVPSALALIFLRPYRRFWTGLAICALALAATGAAAAVLYAAGRRETATPLAFMAQLSVLRMLAAPLAAIVMFVCTAFSPHRAPRYALFAAALIECAVSAYAGFVWFGNISAG